MDSIMTYLLTYNQHPINIICKSLLFISQHIILNQMIFDNSNSPEYQKFKEVDYILLLAYYKHKYNKTVKPIQRLKGKSIAEKINVLTMALRLRNKNNINILEYINTIILNLYNLKKS